jgi:hypothetical protein
LHQRSPSGIVLDRVDVGALPGAQPHTRHVRSGNRGTIFIDNGGTECIIDS